MLPPVTSSAAPPRGEAALREAAEKLEAGFLAEMLKAAGLGAPREAFGGGAGEEQFASFLREKQAEAMVESGGIGLAEALFEALKESQHAGPP
jgi:Rod binding domain-containing protein